MASVHLAWYLMVLIGGASSISSFAMPPETSTHSADAGDASTACGVTSCDGSGEEAEVSKVQVHLLQKSTNLGRVSQDVKLMQTCLDECREIIKFFSDYGAGVALVHIAKTGGTTIEVAFELPGSVYHCTAQQFVDCDVAGAGLALFTAVRNPFERTVSAYEMALRNEKYKYVLSFAEYVQAIRETVLHNGDAGCATNTRQVECIFGTNGQNLVQYFLHTETLNDDWEKLQETIPKLPDLLPLEEARNVGDYPAFCAYYDDAVAENVATLYAGDFAFLNLSTDLSAHCGVAEIQLRRSQQEFAAAEGAGANGTAAPA